jgi:hypothetical protein
VQAIVTIDAQETVVGADQVGRVVENAALW